MLTADTTPGRSVYDSETLSGDVDSKCMRGEGAEPKLDFVNGDRVSSEFTVSQLTAPPAWHRSLGEALLTGDPNGVHEAIVRAQRAILNRYLQLACGWEAQREEEADLGNAVDILQALKGTIERTRFQPDCAVLHSLSR